MAAKPSMTLAEQVAALLESRAQVAPVEEGQGKEDVAASESEAPVRAKRARGKRAAAEEEAAEAAVALAAGDDGLGKENVAAPKDEVPSAGPRAAEAPVKAKRARGKRAAEEDAPAAGQDTPEAAPSGAAASGAVEPAGVSGAAEPVSAPAGSGAAGSKVKAGEAEAGVAPVVEAAGRGVRAAGSKATAGAAGSKASAEVVTSLGAAVPKSGWQRLGEVGDARIPGLGEEVAGLPPLFGSAVKRVVLPERVPQILDAHVRPGDDLNVGRLTTLVLRVLGSPASRDSVADLVRGWVEQIEGGNRAYADGPRPAPRKAKVFGTKLEYPFEVLTLQKVIINHRPVSCPDCGTEESLMFSGQHKRRPIDASCGCGQRWPIVGLGSERVGEVLANELALGQAELLLT